MGKQQSQSDSDEQSGEIRRQLKTAMTRARVDERLEDNTGLSQETKEVALRELNYLIDSTAQQDDDPLTDDVFRARNELRENLTEVTDNE